jgi:glycosyltransferase involved in cell wall biosynthesis
VVTIHSERLFDYGNIKRIIALFFISKTKRLQLISVSKKLNDFLESKKIPSFHLPAYVPPSNVDCKEVEDSNELFLFSVWKLNRKLAEEIYNVPLAFEFLRKNKENLTMLFMVGNKLGSNLDYLEEIMSKYGVKDNLKVVFDENLVDYVHNCRFLLRPNKSDGYGVSLQEALDLGIPAIASDVCVRPKGTLLFENDNLKDMTNKINQVLNSQKENFLKEKEDLKYHTELIQLYKRLSSNETSNTEL